MGKGMKELSIFKGKRVLVTGHTGFKGSWLSQWLLELGAQVTGLALAPLNDQEHFCLAGLEKHLDHQVCDIRDLNGVNQVFAKAKPEILFHLAAQPLVRYSYEAPKETFDTNVGGSLNILEAARRSPNLGAVVFVTTDKCYQNQEWHHGYRENDRLGGHDPYSASKAAAEILFQSYLRSFFDQNPEIGLASGRAGNVIGGGDWAKDRIVPDCIRALAQGNPVRLRNPKATRPWQHVLDPLFGYLKLAARLYENPKAYPDAFNFGPAISSIQPVGRLAEAVVEAWGSGKLEISQDPNAVHEATLLHLNCDLAYQKLDWEPVWGFERAVKETTLWYLKQHQGQSVPELTQTQIKTFT
ncbi:MAG: CDP-glucose 4,6-dehydratase, partial [Candidatus Lambdaproteobacteria bacterium RIFOXYD12_FULL_49_8]